MKYKLYATLITSLLATSASMAENEWNGKPTVYGVNTLKPHVTSMPYSSLKEALKGMVPNPIGNLEILLGRQARSQKQRLPK